MERVSNVVHDSLCLSYLRLQEGSLIKITQGQVRLPVTSGKVFTHYTKIKTAWVDFSDLLCEVYIYDFCSTEYLAPESDCARPFPPEARCHKP